MERVGMTGHSFGARTTMAIGGQVFPLPGGMELSAVDGRVKAALPMSPMPPKIPAQHEVVFSKISIPMMHMTGTLDTSFIDVGRAPEERQIPYEKTTGPEQYLIVFKGGDHMIFSGRPRGMREMATGDPSKDAVFQEMIAMSSTAFWDAYLKGDAEAKGWLKAEEDGLGEALEGEASFEWK
jgi:dienelactone hydrolase